MSCGHCPPDTQPAGVLHALRNGKGAQKPGTECSGSGSALVCSTSGNPGEGDGSLPEGGFKLKERQREPGHTSSHGKDRTLILHVSGNAGRG